MNTIFRMGYRKPFTNEKITEVYETDASKEALEEIKEKIAGDCALSSQKPDLLKQMLKIKGYEMHLYPAEIEIDL